MRKPAEPKPIAWKIYVDYEAAKVMRGAASKNKGTYLNRQGVMALMRSALESGVHPRYIKVEKVYGEWVPDDPLTTCPECRHDFDEPSPNCRLQRNAIRRNEGRARHRADGNLAAWQEQLELPHRDGIIIIEQPLISDPA